MANYIFEEMTDADAEAFTPSDTLRFSSASVTPANVTFSNNGLDLTLVTSGGKTLTFQGTSLSGADILFTSSFIAGNESGVILGNADANNFSIDDHDDADDGYAYGFAGNDTIDGGDGDDYVFGGAGGDSIDGDSGSDHLYGFGLTGSFSTDGDDQINGNDGNDYIQGNGGKDTLSGGSHNDRINGGADNDVITGDTGNDTVNGNKGEDNISGGDGNDSLRGGADNDVVTGNAGNDVLLGDLGDDTITGGTGIDVLTGGAGADLFQFADGDVGLPETEDEDSDVFGLVDTITDFTDGEDLLNVGFVVEDVFDQQDGVTFSSVSAALTYAQQRLDNADEPEVSLIEAQIGNDLYLFYDSDENLEIDSIIKLVGMQAEDFDTDDFIAVG